MAGTASRSKSQILKDHLMREMVEYRIPIGGQLPTEADLMRRFQVSRGTVQRVLADLSTQGLLRREQGRGTFRTAPASRPASAPRSMLVGVWFNQPRSPMWSPVIDSLRQELDYWGYHGVYEEGGLAVGAEGRGIASLVRKSLDGFIVAPSNNPEDDHRPLVELISRQVPIVMVDRSLPEHETDLVTCTNEIGAEQLTAHLLDLGHRRVGFIGVPGLETVDDRARGYRLTLQRRGVSIDDRWISQSPGTLRDCGREAARAMLTLPAEARPTALLGANDYIAETCAIAARERGLQVPEDLSIVGFDDANPMPEQEPWLTTYAQPRESIGRQAARLLMKRISEPTRRNVTLVLEGRLVVRRSTAPPPTQTRHDTV